MRTSVLLTAMMLMLSVPTFSADDKPKADTVPDAKVYLIYGFSLNKAAILEGVEAVDFKGMKCLKGRHADISWMKGRICYIPVNQITMMVEYDSFEQYKENVQNFHNEQLK